MRRQKQMRGKAAVILLSILVTALTMSTSGCSKFSRPSDAEVLKAIDDSGLLRSQAFTITSPLVIVERGNQNQDGSWPVRVKMTMTMQLPDGKISEPKENAAYFRISKIKDSAGHSVWKATLGP
jgi:hypothetical protein